MTANLELGLATRAKVLGDVQTVVLLRLTPECVRVCRWWALQSVWG